MKVQLAHDPVCHSTIRPTHDHPQATYEGRTWYFCSNRCRTLFALDPAAVIAEEERCQHETAAAAFEAEVARSYSVYEVEAGAVLLRAFGIGVEVVKSPPDIEDEPVPWFSATAKYAIWTETGQAGRAADYLREAGLFD